MENDWPRFYEFIAMTTGLLPWWAWAWMFTAIIAAAAIEYATRLRMILHRDDVEVRTVAHLVIRRDEYGEYDIGSSTNVKHLRTCPEEIYRVEFIEPIRTVGLLIKDGVTGEEVEILEKTKHRVMFKLNDVIKLSTVKHFLFESAYV